MYQFTDDCLIGVDQIDNEHRRLFELVNEAANLLMRNDINRSDVNAVLMELDEYAVLHFRHEEEYMKEINDPELPRQKEMHQAFVVKLKEIEQLDVEAKDDKEKHYIPLESLNINRVVLARETELSTIKYIKNNSDIEIEVFAHGALCISYSGNCLHSSFIGKRSGNRGTCAQPCRMEYTLLDNDRPVGTKKYLLSTKDLNTLENIDKLIDSNVSSLKIEGRMKSKEYVALVVKTYREAIDNYYENKINKVDHLAIENMKLVFSRGFTKGFMFYEKNSDFTNTFRPSHIGVKIGKVISTKNNKVQIKLSSDIKQKDKIAIVQDRFDDIRMFLSKIYVKNKLVPMGYKDETIELVINSKVSKDADVYKIVDNDLMESINETYLKNAKKIPLRAKFISNVNEPIALILKDNNNHSVLVKSEYIVEKANNSPTTSSKIEEQLNKLDFEYDFVNINKFEKKELLEKDSMVSYAMAIDKCNTNEEVFEVLDMLTNVIKDTTRKDYIKRLVIHIFKDCIEERERNERDFI